MSRWRNRRIRATSSATTRGSCWLSRRYPPIRGFVLDWNATRAGRLARTRPVDVSTLPTLSEPAVGVSDDALSALHNRREVLKKEIRELNDEIAATPPGPVGEVFN